MNLSFDFSILYHNALNDGFGTDNSFLRLFQMMTRVVIMALVASLAVASAATCVRVPSVQRAALSQFASHATLRLRGGIADEELAVQQVRAE